MILRRKKIQNHMQGDGSTRKRERCVSKVEEENDKEFSLKELYESNNIQDVNMTYFLVIKMDCPRNPFLQPGF
ncbi:hypothetical protein HanIR_Chr07g0303851 [Helianthus annuus]|nr:hypothetical protein HanIR_Chr07g0303851 [Helianthus annuus]